MCLNAIQENKIKTFYRIASYAIIFYCIALRFYYFTHDKFFWLDESLLFLSLYDADLLSVITQKNIYLQTYPSLFGFISFVFIKILGISPCSLRFISFVSSCAFFPLLYILSKKIIDEKYAFICLLVSSFNYLLIYYCNEYKQYSTEATVTLVLLLYYFSNPYKTNITYTFVTISILSIFLSTPSPFIILSIIICFYINSLFGVATKKIVSKTISFIKDNFFQFLLLGVVSILYYYLCLRNGDANNGNVWGQGMLPHNLKDMPSWFKDVFVVILSRLMSNGALFKLGTIVLYFAFFGIIISIFSNNSFSKFTRVFVVVFFISISGIYSLGLVSWGIKGARLSLYIIPIIVLFSSFFIYNALNIIYKYIDKLYLYLLKLNKNINKLSILAKSGIVVVFVALCLNSSRYATYELYEVYSENFKHSYMTNILEKNRQNIILSTPYVWYSLQYYNIYKKYHLNITKLGNYYTPQQVWNPETITFTIGFHSQIENLERNNNLLLFVPLLKKSFFLKCISRYGVVVEMYDFSDICLMIIKK